MGIILSLKRYFSTERLNKGLRPLDLRAWKSNRKISSLFLLQPGQIIIKPQTSLPNCLLYSSHLCLSHSDGEKRRVGPDLLCSVKNLPDSVLQLALRTHDDDDYHFQSLARCLLGGATLNYGHIYRRHMHNVIKLKLSHQYGRCRQCMA